MDLPESGPLHGNFVLLRAGALALLLPQGEVGAAVHADAAHAAGERAAISEAMTLLPTCAADRFVGVALAGTEGLTWWWNDLRVLIDARLDVQPLPPQLRGPGSPLASFTVIDGQPVFPCHAEAVGTHALMRGGDDAP
jgi:hypothetical protein